MALVCDPLSPPLNGKSHEKFPLFLGSLPYYLVSPRGSFFVVVDIDSLFGLSASMQAVRQNQLLADL